MDSSKERLFKDTIDSLNYIIESLPKMNRAEIETNRIDMSWSEYFAKNKVLVSKNIREMGRNIASKMIEDESDPVKKEMTKAVLKPFL
jgi:hypoxanthine phosphoribosyltransferase